MNLELWNNLKVFKDKCKIVDLSHPVSPMTPHWAGFESMSEKTIYNFAQHNFIAKEYSIVSQYATHIDAPGHFSEGGRMLEEISLSDTILPLVVINKSQTVATNPDYTIVKDDILQFEKEYGPIPEGAFVALRTDWSKRTENFDNIDDNGIAHYPGWSIEACEYLIKFRGVKAIGHETSDTDSTAISVEAGGLPVETYVLAQNIFQVELMKNLDEMPAMGGLILVAFPNIIDAPGFTARCYGFAPK